MFSQLLYCHFHTTGLLSLPQSEIRAGKLLVDPGHLQEEQVGVTPHHHYRRARCHHPVVDTSLKNNTHIADDQNNCLFKMKGFQLVLPSHLFPNTPRIIQIWLFLSQSAATIRLKGKVSRDFLLLVFFINQSPPPPQSIPSWPLQFFQKFPEIFASQGAPPVSTPPVANLSPVSTTSVANWPGINNTGGKQWEQYRTADTLKWTWKQKFIYMFQKVSQQNYYNFSDWRFFFICRHQWWTLSSEYLRKFLKKFEMALTGKLIHEKNQKSKISWYCFFKVIVRVVFH